MMRLLSGLLLFLLTLQSVCGAPLVCIVEDSGTIYDVVRKNVSQWFLKQDQKTRPEKFQIRTAEVPDRNKLLASPDTEVILICGEMVYGAEIFAVDAALFAVPKTNPVDDMPISIVRRALDSGTIRWNDSGKKTSAVIYRKETGIMPAAPLGYSTSDKHIADSVKAPAMQWNVPGLPKKEKPKPSKVIFTDSDEATLLLAAKDPNALAILSAKALFEQEMKFLKVKGVPPAVETLLDGTYPCSRKFYIVRGKNNHSANGTALYDFLKSPEFGRLLFRSGLIPLTGDLGKRLKEKK